MAAADRITLKTKAGKEVSIQITPDTKVVNRKQPVKIEDVKAGTRVVVAAVTEKQRIKAKSVRSFPSCIVGSSNECILREGTECEGADVRGPRCHYV